MRVLFFLPFTFACGAEGFALFAPYLLLVLTVMHVARAFHHAKRALPAPVPQSKPSFDMLSQAQPAI
jgi:hypothetical protein